MSRARKPLIADQGVATAVGLAATVLAVVMLWDAFEGRGRQRPFIMRFLPGP